MRKFGKAPFGLKIIFTFQIIGIFFLVTKPFEMSLVLGYPAFDHGASVVFNLIGIVFDLLICFGIYGGETWLRKFVIYWAGFYILVLAIESLFWFLNWDVVATEINMNDLPSIEAGLLVGFSFLVIIFYLIWASNYIYLKKDYFDGK